MYTTVQTRRRSDVRHGFSGSRMSVLHWLGLILEANGFGQMLGNHVFSQVTGRRGMARMRALKQVPTQVCTWIKPGGKKMTSLEALKPCEKTMKL